MMTGADGADVGAEVKKSKRIELARALASLAADSNRDPGMTGASMPPCWKQMMRRTATYCNTIGNLAFSLEL